MENTTPGRSRKKTNRRAQRACPTDYYRHSDDDRALLAARFPQGGLPAQVRFLLDQEDWTLPMLASRASLTRLTVRLLARGWRLPVGPGPRREVRRLVADQVCPACIADRRRERQEEQAAGERRARREELRARRRAMEEARHRKD